jgi:hypothetical protein
MPFKNFILGIGTGISGILSSKTNLRMEMCEGPDHEGAQFTAHQEKRTLLGGRKCNQAVQVRHHAHCAEQLT